MRHHERSSLGLLRKDLAVPQDLVYRKPVASRNLLQCLRKPLAVPQATSCSASGNLASA